MAEPNSTPLVIGDRVRQNAVLFRRAFGVEVFKERRELGVIAVSIDVAIVFKVFCCAKKGGAELNYYSCCWSYSYCFHIPCAW
jgi:hypothetical protein